LQLTFWFALAFIVLMLFSCKKYPEGGTKHDAKSKLQGLWAIDFYQIDGADSLNYLLDSVFTGCTGNIELLIRDSPGKWQFTLMSCDSMSNSCTECDNWSVFGDNDSLHLTVFLRRMLSVPAEYFVFSHDWRILKLNNDDLWLEREENGKLYEFRLSNND